MATFPLFNSMSCDHQKNKEWEKAHLSTCRATVKSHSHLHEARSEGWSGFTRVRHNTQRVKTRLPHLRSGNRETRASVPLSPVGVGTDLQHGGPVSFQHLGGVGQVEEVKLHVDGSWRILPGLKCLGASLQDHFLRGEGEEGRERRGQRLLGH